MSRKLARESSMQILYQMELLENYDKKNLEDFLKNNEFEEDEEEFIESIVTGVSGNLEEIDNYIKRNMDSWSIRRLAKVDLSILRISIYEILYREDIPKQVSINEAIEIAKKYSTEESSKFINGILGGFVRELNSEK